jgi:hypothetical protein
MGNEIDVAALARSWTHAHEEDEGDHLVFRPSELEFAPSRGRESFALGPDHALTRSGPGPDDRRAFTTGTWSVDGRQLVLQVPGHPEERLEIVSVDPEQLVVRR